MSDLQLASLNKAGQTTTLEAVTTNDDQPVSDESGTLQDFFGSFVLEVRAAQDLYVSQTAPSPFGPTKNNFGGIWASGVGIGTGVIGSSQSGQGVQGAGSIGVQGVGRGQDALGVHGVILEGSGVGVLGEGNPGVSGISAVSAGVQGEGMPGVLGHCSVNPIMMETIAHQVQAPGHFAGVNGDSAHGTGVYGGQFQGSRAQLSLLPGTGVGKPTSGQHDLGEIYMDSAASLFVCIAGGTPGA